MVVQGFGHLEVASATHHAAACQVAMRPPYKLAVIRIGVLYRLYQAGHAEKFRVFFTLGIKSMHVTAGAVRTS